MKIGKYMQCTLVSTVALFACSAMASDWIVRGGVHHIEPSSDNGQAAGLDLDIGSNTRPSVSLTWMASDRVCRVRSHISHSRLS